MDPRQTPKAGPCGRDPPSCRHCEAQKPILPKAHIGEPGKTEQKGFRDFRVDQTRLSYGLTSFSCFGLVLTITPPALTQSAELPFSLCVLWHTAFLLPCLLAGKSRLFRFHAWVLRKPPYAMRHPAFQISCRRRAYSEKREETGNFHVALQSPSSATCVVAENHRTPLTSQQPRKFKQPNSITHAALSTADAHREQWLSDLLSTCGSRDWCRGAGGAQPVKTPPPRSSNLSCSRSSVPTGPCQER